MKSNGSAGRQDDDRLYTVAEIARLDGCSTRTVRRSIAMSLLDALRIGPGGRCLRITQAAHQRYRDRCGR